MDALYAAGIHGHALTAIQAWKDVLCSSRLARVAFDAARARRLSRFDPCFRMRSRARVRCRRLSLYALIPQDALGGHATHKAVAYALRHDLAGVAAYFVGRAVVPRMREVRWLVLAASRLGRGVGD
jgi:hypothetical protein